MQLLSVAEPPEVLRVDGLARYRPGVGDLCHVFPPLCRYPNVCVVTRTSERSGVRARSTFRHDTSTGDPSPATSQCLDPTAHGVGDRIP